MRRMLAGVLALSLAASPVEVCFSPEGGCTDAVVKALGEAKTTVRIQAYGLTFDGRKMQSQHRRVWK